MKLDAITLRRLSPLLDEALDLEGAARESWFAGLSGEAALLAPTLRALLARQSTVETNDFLARGPEFTAPGGETHTSDFAAGGAIGPYRLLRVIGHGGMGEVWLAERADGQLKRNVALKLPMLSLRRNVLVQRFERERDILGALVHPNIARLYDAGLADDGQPYMALEYVEGQPITAAADAQALDAKARVRLLQQVMDAVQYAHANLVIHRDLKPGNVLVTADGKAMLLDFGIAKLVEDEAGAAAESELTRLGGRALTLHYAAPEQVSGAPISTAADIWALGVLLYELLTGLKPFSGDGRGKLEEDVLKGQPARPSQRKAGAITRISKSLASDLDTIVLMALKKNPAERYATVNALADDLNRWLQGEAVLAQPDSRWYRTRKFVGRYRLAVATATTAMLVVIGIATVAVIQGIKAREEAARAVAARNFLVEMFEQVDPDQMKGKEITGKELLAQGYKTAMTTLNAQPELQAYLLASIAEAQAHMGDLESAEKSMETVSQVAEKMGDPKQAANAMILQATLTNAVGDYARTQKLISGALQRHPRYEGDDTFMAVYLHLMADGAVRQGDFQQAKEFATAAIPRAKKVWGPKAERPVWSVRLLATIESRLGNYQSASEHLKSLIAELDADSTVRPALVVGTRLMIAKVERSRGNFKRAKEQFEVVLARCADTLDPKSVVCVEARNDMMEAMFLLGDYPHAVKFIPVLLPDAMGSRLQAAYLQTLVNAHHLLAMNGMLASQPGIVERIKTLGDSPVEPDRPEVYKVWALIHQGEASLFEKNAAAAAHHLDRAERRFKAATLKDDNVLSYLRGLQGLTAQAQGKFDEALSVLEAGVAESAKRFGADHPATQLAAARHARVLWATSQRDKALLLLDHAIPILREAMGTDAPKFRKIEALREEIASTLPNAETARKVDVLL